MMVSTPKSAARGPCAAALLGVLLTVGVARAQERIAEGERVFQTHCRSCHTADPASRAPSPGALRQRTPSAIVDALSAGAMRYQGLPLSGAEKRAVAEFLTGKTMSGDPVGATMGRCTSREPFTNARSGAAWNGWSPSAANTHFQTAAAAGLTAAQVSRLTLKWAFGFPDAAMAWSQPTVVGGRVFVGSQGGVAYALDAKSGCIHWAFVAAAGVRSSISIGPYKTPDSYAAYFSDAKGNVYAVDAATGAMLWTRDVEEHPLVRMTGSPTLHDGVLYVPVSSFEEGLAATADYPCCTFRGKLVALDAISGAIKWTAYTVDEPKPLGKNAQGVQLWGPSGGAIWSAPTIDVKRGAVYVATGNGYSAPVQKTTDAILAFDLATGRLRWSRQVLAEVYGCRPELPNCTKPGPDHDFGAPPALATLPNGKDVIVAGQKSGDGFALDPDNSGEILWRYYAVDGDITGGIVWGTATDGDAAYFPISCQSCPRPGGVHAVNLVSGTAVWIASPPTELMCGARGRGCSAAQPVAISVIPGVLFAGSIDGALRAYSTRDGSVIWSFNTNHEFETVNRVPGKGASIIGPGPVVAGGMVFVSSGYGTYGGRPGNVLLAFGVD